MRLGTTTRLQLKVSLPRADSVGTDHRKMRRHRELSRVNRVEAVPRGHTNIVALMEFAVRIVDVGLAPSYNHPTLDANFQKILAVERANEGTMAEIARNVPSMTWLRSGSHGSPDQSGGFKSLEMPCKHVAYHVR